MKRIVLIVFVALAALQVAAPAFAARARVVHRGPHGGPHGRTDVVVVRRGFPLHRRLPVVVVRPAPVVRVMPRIFLAPLVWNVAVIDAMPASCAPVWEDSESLSDDEGWTEFTLNADQRGTKLYLQVGGHVQFNFAEVVFENGDSQVVDFDDHEHKIGLYSLLDFKDGRKVDHVRVVAKANSDATTVGVRLLT